MIIEPLFTALKLHGLGCILLHSFCPPSSRTSCEVGPDTVTRTLVWRFNLDKTSPYSRERKEYWGSWTCLMLDLVFQGTILMERQSPTVALSLHLFRAQGHFLKPYLHSPFGASPNFGTGWCNCSLKSCRGQIPLTGQRLCSCLMVQNVYIRIAPLVHSLPKATIIRS